MALSKSLEIKGQVILSCQMCEEENQIKWKCLTCNSLMCNRCRKVHEKFKSSEEHKIIDLKDVAAHQETSKNLDFSNIWCGNHSGQKCCLFCSGCQEVVCPLCIAETHNMHKLIQMKDGYEIALETLKRRQENLNMDLLQSKSNMAAFKNLKSENISTFEKEKEKILTRQKTLEDEIRKFAKSLLDELNEKFERLAQSTDESEQEAKQVHMEVTSRKSKIDDIINSNNAAEIFRSLGNKDIDKNKMTPKLPNKTMYKMLKFIPGKQNPNDIARIFGSLKNNEEIIKPCLEIQFTEVAHYNTKLDQINSIVHVPDGPVWISHFLNGILQNVSFTTDGTVNVSTTLKFKKIAKMKLTSSGDLLLSVQESNLHIYNPITGKISKTQYSVKPLITNSALHFSNDKIMLGAREPGPMLPPSGPRKVLVMDMQGKVEKTYHLDNNRQPIFTCPVKITCDKSNDIYLTDLLSDDGMGRLIKLSPDPNSGISGVFTVNQGSSTPSYLPADIAATDNDHIIVIEYIQSKIYILNTDLQCLNSTSTREFGVMQPLSLDIDRKGMLVFGCLSNKNQPDAKISVVKFSEF